MIIDQILMFTWMIIGTIVFTVLLSIYIVYKVNAGPSEKRKTSFFDNNDSSSSFFKSNDSWHSKDDGFRNNFDNTPIGPVQNAASWMNDPSNSNIPGNTFYQDPFNKF